MNPAARPHTYLVMTAGNRSGTAFVLDPDGPNTIGRGTDCTITITDPLCSRVHAMLDAEGGVWHVRDSDSRNGMYVNGRKTDDAALDDGHTIRCGSTEFSFHQSEQPPTVGPEVDLGITQTIVKDTPVRAQDSTVMPSAGDEGDTVADELYLLYELSVKLVATRDPNEVVQLALRALHQRTKAAVVGFLWLSDEGQLEPKVVIPEDAADSVRLSESLTKLVIEQGHAVWIANQAAGNVKDSVSLKHYADAVCAPLAAPHGTLGALHVYLREGRFRQSDFDFGISVARLLAAALARAREESSLQADYRRLVEESPGHNELVGESEPMRALKLRIERVAQATGCVMVRGESGVGKELVARAIHRASPRADRPMLSVNCAAIPAELMESQLFGHKVGAFTGADREHAGFFKQADLGTLFLDEVGEMTLAGQAKLLRILEGHPFLPVGATEEVRVDVRVIAATNQNLQQYVRDKRFREDLYYRLSVFELVVPPLRDRGDDIARLVEFFLERFRDQQGRPQLELSDAARTKLLAYHWPGNVRQLRNVIDSAVVLAANAAIEPEDLSLHDTGPDELGSLRIDDWEKRLIGEALKRTGGNVPEAARLLGIGRATLYRKIEQYEISR